MSFGGEENVLYRDYGSRQTTIYMFSKLTEPIVKIGEFYVKSYLNLKKVIHNKSACFSKNHFSKKYFT